MRDRIELLVKELRAVNLIDNDTCSKWAGSLGYEDLGKALAGEINNPDRERYLVLQTKIRLTSQHIYKLEKILFETSPDYKIQLFKRVFKSQISEVMKYTWNTDMETLRTLAVSIEADLGDNNHHNEDIVIVDGHIVDWRCSEDMARAVMDYLDIPYEEEE